MPVTKYRDFESARRDLWRDPHDPELLRDSANLLHLAHRLSMPLPILRGISRYRSLDEANADRERCLSERIRRLREERGRG